MQRGAERPPRKEEEKEFIPLSVYVHVPWCVAKCPYCDFHSYPLRGPLPEEAFVAAVVTDLARERERVGERRVKTIFFGGGTPSLLSPSAVGSVVEAVDRWFGVAEGVEVTLEINPGTSSLQRLQGWRSAGVNRVSVGVQSLSPAGLRRLGRIHGPEEALATVAAAVGLFPHVNGDLIYGWPGEESATAAAEVRTLAALGVDHLSLYELTLEPNTGFAVAPPADLPGEEALADLERVLFEEAEACGLTRYEVSAWSRAGGWCHHNVNYWCYGDYVGVGPGAHGKVTQREGEGVVVERRVKTFQPSDYLLAAQRGEGWVAREWVVPEEERPFEFLMNGLRLRAGVPRALFSARTGVPWESVAERWEELVHRGWVEPVTGEEGWLRCTPLGWRYLNEVLCRFLGEGDKHSSAARR
ncbi:MAG: radical SAM family heme chaperone HemW [Hydrogenophilus sp.]|nr:radical SAM family heme chaperone HemW [Hydrogenophilus sp.]